MRNRQIQLQTFATRFMNRTIEAILEGFDIILIETGFHLAEYGWIDLCTLSMLSQIRICV